jgi:hypothetical protein
VLDLLERVRPRLHILLLDLLEWWRELPARAGHHRHERPVGTFTARPIPLAEPVGEAEHERAQLRILALWVGGSKRRGDGLPAIGFGDCVADQPEYLRIDAHLSPH